MPFNSNSPTNVKQKSVRLKPVTSAAYDKLIYRFGSECFAQLRQNALRHILEANKVSPQAVGHDPRIAFGIANLGLALVCDGSIFTATLLSNLCDMTLGQIMAARAGVIELPIEEAVLTIPITSHAAVLAIALVQTRLRGYGRGNNQLGEYRSQVFLVEPTRRKSLAKMAMKCADSVLRNAADMAGLHRTLRFSEFGGLAGAHWCRQPQLGPTLAATGRGTLRTCPAPNIPMLSQIADVSFAWLMEAE